MMTQKGPYLSEPYLGVEEILAPFASMKQQLVTLAMKKGEEISSREKMIKALQEQNRRDSNEGQLAMLAADRLQWMIDNPTGTPYGQSESIRNPS